MKRPRQKILVPSKLSETHDLENCGAESNPEIEKNGDISFVIESPFFDKTKAAAISCIEMEPKFTEKETQTVRGVRHFKNFVRGFQD